MNVALQALFGGGGPRMLLLGRQPALIERLNWVRKWTVANGSFAPCLRLGSSLQ